MFQLIVAVISIALVAALAIASIFYGGDAFTQSSAKANVTTLVNQGQQISGASQLYKTDNAKFTTVADLVAKNYLAVTPTPSKIATGAWSIVTNGTKNYAIVAFAPGVDASTATGLCKPLEGEVIKQNGLCLDSAGAAGVTHFGFAL